MDLTKTSRFISLILRHKPETIDIALDEHGWANVSELIDGIQKHNISIWRCWRKLLRPITSNDTLSMKIRL